MNCLHTYLPIAVVIVIVSNVGYFFDDVIVVDVIIVAVPSRCCFLSLLLLQFVIQNKKQVFNRELSKYPKTVPIEQRQLIRSFWIIK